MRASFRIIEIDVRVRELCANDCYRRREVIYIVIRLKFWPIIHSCASALPDLYIPRKSWGVS